MSRRFLEEEKNRLRAEQEYFQQRVQNRRRMIEEVDQLLVDIQGMRVRESGGGRDSATPPERHQIPEGRREDRPAGTSNQYQEQRMVPAGYSGARPKTAQSGQRSWTRYLPNDTKREPERVRKPIRLVECHPDGTRTPIDERPEDLVLNKSNPINKRKAGRPPKDIRDWNARHGAEDGPSPRTAKEDFLRRQYRRQIMSLEAQLAGKEEGRRMRLEAEEKKDKRSKLKKTTRTMPLLNQ
ncbi:uncharacterized protein LOC127279865 [Leptopilina boulardi]|uniref:uncharacterized protein LOC127279865 n=1 Tax=Leptopilina boulardi TaxID=63433 RepID=UPI0021F59AB5|nr:uncharacterized protein LOC127279865 [Leptopilina boulardi]